MNIGLDVGYSAVKAVSGNRRVTFPSVVGTPDKARFSLDGSKAIILTQPMSAMIGEEAIAQSRFLNRREDRGWVESDEWYALAPSQHTLSEPAASKQATMADPGREATIADDGRQYTPPERAS